MRCAHVTPQRLQGPAYNGRMAKFTVISGTPPPDTPRQRLVDRVKARARPETMLQCPRCGGREVLELKAGVMFQNGKTKGGTKQIVCACCFMKGERVVLA
jgi:hypothetical protein